MRVPCIRRGDDNTPFAWWEWLCYPLVMPLFLAVMLVLGVLSVPLEVIGRVQTSRGETKLRHRLAESGRWSDWTKVRDGLERGEGTLIIEHLSPQGPVREWWTQDDVAAGAPAPLPSSIKATPVDGQVEAIATYAKTCQLKYCDPESGAAQLTSVPQGLGSKLDPRKLVTVDLGGVMTCILLHTGRRLAETYPKGKVVTLIDWTGWIERRLLLLGDAEAVFLGAPSSRCGETASSGG